MSDQAKIITLEVDRTNWSTTRWVESALPKDLAPGQVLLRVNRFAVTANNISYAASGDALGYWCFFPAEDNWGRIPAMGYADVVESACEGIEVGSRVWGFFPFSNYLVIEAGQVSDFSFSDVSAHREGLAPLYARFDRTSANPIYQKAREDQDLLLRGLFLTSWLVEDFMQDNAFFEAEDFLITSASSKTSIALAHCVRKRGEKRAIGITSASRVEFTRSLGCYDVVVSYDEIGSLDASRPVISVDMAGNSSVLRQLHEHFGDNMRYSCKIGATHYDAMEPDSEQAMPGAKPIFFFAPGQAKKRAQEWGPGQVEMRIGSDFVAFREFADQWLTVTPGKGREAVEAGYQSVLSGKLAPNEGMLLSLQDEWI